jgi:epoxyqueuosine reductase
LAASLTAALKEEARRLGFPAAGACAAVAPPGFARFEEWLDAGYAGEMRYLGDRAAAYSHPRSVLEGVQSILMLAMPYRTEVPRSPGPGHGRVSRYAWGSDYHDLIHDRLRCLAEFHRRLVPQAQVRGVVDTAPLLEREFARLAGLGWIGKNTLLLNRALGSWFFLAALLTSEPLECDAPFAADHCGTCTACLDACPTGALVAPRVLDARRCISYLTIELRGPVPRELREGTGDWVFGCDVCQEVCPWNRRAPAGEEQSLGPRPGSNPMELTELFGLDDAAFRARFRGTPLWRPKRRGLLRNAAVALGNRPFPEALPALARGLNDLDAVVRGASAWALGHYRGPSARQALNERLATEADPDVRDEIETALGASDG